MKQFKYILPLLIIAMITIGACKTKSATAKSQTTTPTCKVAVTFGSRGDGINQKKMDELTALLDTRKVKYTSKVVGREGEKEICIPLTELKDKEKTEFIEQLKTFEDKNTFISLSIN